MTVELITEVQEVETSFCHQRDIHRAQVIVEEEQVGTEMVLKVHSYLQLFILLVFLSSLL